MSEKQISDFIIEIEDYVAKKYSINISYDFLYNFLKRVWNSGRDSISLDQLLYKEYSKGYLEGYNDAR